MYLTYLCKMSFLLIPGLFAVSLVHAADFGRLFTSAEDREVLESLRQSPSVSQEITTEKSAPLTEQVMVPVVPETMFTLKGMVRRSDGKNTVWINGDTFAPGDEGPLYIEVDDTLTKADVGPTGSRVITSRNGTIIVNDTPDPQHE